MKNWITFGEIYLTIQTNAFLYYCTKLPFLNLLVRATWYGRYRLKRLFTVFGVLLGFVKEALATNLGLLFLLHWIPSLIAPQYKMGNSEILFLFLGIKCAGALVDGCRIFNSSPEDYTFLNHFMVDPKTYYLYKVLRFLFFSSVMSFPALLYLFGDVSFVVSAICVLLGCELMGNVFFLSYYKWKNKLPNKRVRQLLNLLLWVGSYLALLVFRTPVIPLGNTALLSMAAVALVVSFFCWHYHKRFSGYKEIAVRFGDQSAVSVRVSIQSVGEDVRGLTEGTWEENKAFFEKNSHLPAAEYLHQAFWARFGKIIYKDVRVQCITLWVILSGLGLGVRMGWVPFDSGNVLQYSPILLSMTMSFALANRLMMMYFRNIDLHLLFHRMTQSRYIQESMTRRYLHVLGMDIVFTFAVLVALVLFLLLSGTVLDVLTLVQLVAAFASFLVILDTYQVVLYYFVQPYTVDLTVKSPLIKLLQIVEGLSGLVILFVRSDITLALPVLASLAAIVVAGCLLLTRIAHRFFKLRY